jgi:hypothetical protein
MFFFSFSNSLANFQPKFKLKTVQIPNQSILIRGGLDFVTETFTVKGICKVLRYEGKGGQKCQFLRYVIKERSLID